jgi:phosphoribosylaminoimidazole-succinocarboxamide synthase
MDEVILETQLPDIKPYSTGKVRDIYDLGDRLLIIATDRLSAFDVVLPTPIPYKGKILTGLSAFWFNFTRHIVDNHFITTDIADFPGELRKYSDILAGRSMIVKKARRIDIECVARAYLAGSAWRSYKENGSICGIRLPPGLRESDRLPEPIFTPTTKAEAGHDMALTQSEVEDMVGRDVAREIKEKSLELLAAASAEVESKGLILSDTKFEFGKLENDAIMLIDEAFTPDSSRFWPMDDYEPGRPQRSFDKQYVRDYLEEIGWNKKPPAPHLPGEVVKRTTERYFEAYRRITGRTGL